MQGVTGSIPGQGSSAVRCGPHQPQSPKKQKTLESDQAPPPLFELLYFKINFAEIEVRKTTVSLTLKLTHFLHWSYYVYNMKFPNWAIIPI